MLILVNLIKQYQSLLIDVDSLSSVADNKMKCHETRNELVCFQELVNKIEKLMILAHALPQLLADHVTRSHHLTAALLLVWYEFRC